MVDTSGPSKLMARASTAPEHKRLIEFPEALHGNFDIILYNFETFLARFLSSNSTHTRRVLCSTQRS